MSRGDFYALLAMIVIAPTWAKTEPKTAEIVTIILMVLSVLFSLLG